MQELKSIKKCMSFKMYKLAKEKAKKITQDARIKFKKKCMRSWKPNRLKRIDI